MEPLLELEAAPVSQPVRAKRNKKKYKVKRVNGVRIPVHRILAQRLIGRELLPDEVVHHLDGDSTNNTPENVLVLPSQRHHASLEYHLRQERRGQVSLFPELLTAGQHQQMHGTLFEAVMLTRKRS